MAGSTPIDDDQEPGEYASPPCFMHELDPAYFGLAPAPPVEPWPVVAAWRKAERKRLIGERLALERDLRAEHSRRIAERLAALIGDPAGRVISAYWPFRGEPDLRGWFRDLGARGVRTALPVVVAMGTPLVFRLWKPGERLVHGVWNIPEPAEGEEVTPDIVIAPVVGFDRGCYRLGYGGGFYDRTLGRLPASTHAIGVGFLQAAMETIRPQSFDVPMRHIVTENCVRTR